MYGAIGNSGCCFCVAPKEICFCMALLEPAVNEPESFPPPLFGACTQGISPILLDLFYLVQGDLSRGVSRPAQAPHTLLNWGPHSAAHTGVRGSTPASLGTLTPDYVCGEDWGWMWPYRRAWDPWAGTRPYPGCGRVPNN